MKFAGYLRPDGSVGVRNFVAVLPTIGCANELAHTIAEQVPGVIPLLHNHAWIRVGMDVTPARKTVITLGKTAQIHQTITGGRGIEPLSTSHTQH